MNKRKLKIVAIGGGTGTFTLLSGLKKYPLDLTAVVTMTDSGGSTGRLRDEFGTLPVGDVRLSLIALAKEEKKGKVLRQLFNYRFPENNSSLSGHNFGNLFLTALTNILGSEAEAIKLASEILDVNGTVLPVTTDNVDLVAEYSDGDVLYGEANIDAPSDKHNGESRLTRLWTQPSASIYKETAKVISNADFIVMGPGDLYSSLLSNVVIKGVPEAIQSSRAKFIYVANLVTKYGQTHSYKLSDYVAEVTRYVGRSPDRVLVNSAPIDSEILSRYAHEKSFPVVDDLQEDNVLRADLVSSEIISRVEGDRVKRSLLRHDSVKLAKVLRKLFI